MRLLLDAQAIYLWTVSDTMLPPRVITALTDTQSCSHQRGVVLGDRDQARQGRLPWPAEGFQVLLDSSFRKLPISPGHAVSAGRLPAHHADLFDRILVTQAETEQMTLVGADPVFSRYGVDVLWS